MKKYLAVLTLLMLGVVGSVSAQDAFTLMGFWEQCAAPQNLPEEIQIGFAGKISGENPPGLSQQYAAQLAVDEINRFDYLGENRRLVLVTQDIGDSAEDLGSALNALAGQSAGIIAPYPTADNVDLYNALGALPVIGIAESLSPEIETAEAIFRIGLTERAAYMIQVRQAAGILDMTQVALIYGDDADSLVSFDAFIEGANQMGVEVLAEVSFAAGTSDFTSTVQTALASTPKGVIVAAPAQDTPQIISILRQAGFSGPILAGRGFDSTSAGPDSEGVIVTADWQIDSLEDASAKFVADYEHAHESLPDAAAAQVYTAAWLLATGIRCADSTDAQLVQDSLSGITGFNSPLGILQVESSRLFLHEPVVQAVSGGQLAVLTFQGE